MLFDTEVAAYEAKLVVACEMELPTTNQFELSLE